MTICCNCKEAPSVVDEYGDTELCQDCEDIRQDHLAGMAPQCACGWGPCSCGADPPTIHDYI